MHHRDDAIMTVSRKMLCGAFIDAKHVEELRETFHLAEVGQMNGGQRWGTFLCQQLSRLLVDDSCTLTRS